MKEKGGNGNFSLRKKLILAAVVCFLVILLMTSLFGKKGLLEIYRTRRHYDDLVRQVERLKEEKSRLEREIEELTNNPEAVDREAREKLWLIKPDEKVVVRSKSK